MPPLEALRLALNGKHSGLCSYGAPTGADVYIFGATHVEFGAVSGDIPKIRREWTLFDETAIWKQILIKHGS